MPAPVASGGSGRRVGLAPTGKAPPCHGARGEAVLRRVASARRSCAHPQTFQASPRSGRFDPQESSVARTPADYRVAPANGYPAIEQINSSGDPTPSPRAPRGAAAREPERSKGFRARALYSDKALDGFHVVDHNRALAQIDQAPAIPVLEDLVDALPAAARHVAELALRDV